MLGKLLLTLIDTVGNLLSIVLFARFVMQWMRVSFRNPIGHFVLAATDWLVVPLRRVVPGLFGLDLASLLPIWVIQTAMVFAKLWVAGVIGTADPLALLGLMWGAGLLETLQLALYFVMGVVLMSAVFSWINPHAPAAGVVFALSEPFLRPFRRVIPPLGGVDLTPIALLLVLQVLLGVLGQAGAMLVGGGLG